MNINRYALDNMIAGVPYALSPIQSFILGLFHLFPLCCVFSFTMAEIGITLETFLYKSNRGRFLAFLQTFESDFYDDERHIHLCRWHERKFVSTLGGDFKE